MKSVENLKKHLKLGQVYRRADLVRWAASIDRHLRQLVKEGVLQKMSRGLYYCPIKASFGNVPPEDEKLVRAFLKSDDFLLISPNLYNSLGVGTTQLYNKQIVIIINGAGNFSLAGRFLIFA